MGFADMLMKTGIGDVSQHGRMGAATLQGAIQNLDAYSDQLKEQGIASDILDASTTKKPGEYFGLEDLKKIASRYPGKDPLEIFERMQKHNQVMKYSRIKSLSQELQNYSKSLKTGLTPRDFEKFMKIHEVDMAEEAPELMQVIKAGQQAGLYPNLMKKDEFTLGATDTRMGYDEEGKPTPVATGAGIDRETGLKIEKPEKYTVYKYENGKELSIPNLTLEQAQIMARQGYGLVKQSQVPETPEEKQKRAKELERFKAGLPGKDKDPDFIQRRDELMRTMNIDEPTATKLTTGQYKVVVSPLTGETSIVDMTSGTGKRVQFGPGEQVEGEGTEKPDINLHEYTKKGTGLGSAILNAISVGSSMVGGPIAKETVKARQALTMAQRNLFLALRESSKVLAFEMKNIFEQYPIDPSILRSPKIAQANMEVIDSFIRRRLEEEKQAEKNTGLPMEERRKAKALIHSMQNFLDILQVPQAETQGSVPTEAIEYLRKNPDAKTKDFFKQKYGYLPEGF